MKRLIVILLPLLVGLILSCKPGLPEQIAINSPDGRTTTILELNSGMPQYAVNVDDQPLILPSQLGYKLRGVDDLRGPFSLKAITHSEIKETWSPVWGQEKHIDAHSNQVCISLTETNGLNRELKLYFRVFDDGVAFRYEIPEQKGLDSIFIAEELTEFRFAMDGQTWWIPGNPNSYEQIYTKSRLSTVVDSAHTPLTVKLDNGLYVSIHEANLTDYSSMTLEQSPIDSLCFNSKLVPWPDGDKVKSQAPMVSPWRTITIARQATDLMKSRMILNLNEPNKLEDTAWIKPMKYIGIWWGLHIGKETWTQGDRHGATTENTKKYIDFAAANNIQGVLVEGWNHDWERYGKSEAFKFNEPYDDYDIEALSEYAASKGVSLIGHHETGREAPYYDAQLEAAYAFLAEYGISTVKTGYAGSENIYPIGVSHHSQWMVKHYRRVLKMAAKYKVALNVHEPIKPTGISRTWPHMMSREGTRGMEWNAWSEGNPPSHTTILPFTRQLAGPIDYTPGIFDLHFDNYKPDNRVKTTLAKQLALMVVLYSPVQMAADLIENYEGQAAFQFIRDLETDWDETIYLEGEIGEHVALARRHENEWFLGAITNENQHLLSIPMQEILKIGMVAECYVDGPGSHWESNPYPMHIESYLANPEDTLRVQLSAGGGAAIRFRPLQAEDRELSSINRLLQDQSK